MIGYIGAFIGGVAATLVVIAAIWRAAPVGYEDGEGFHYGEDPRQAGVLRDLEVLKLSLTAEEIDHIKRRREWAFGG